MTPVKQTNTGFVTQRGDCLEACLASVMDLQIVDVPRMDSWRDIREWAAGRGWEIDHRRPSAHELLGERLGPGGLAIACVVLPHGFLHSVVCLGGELVHDPALRPVADDSCPVLLWTTMRQVS